MNDNVIPFKETIPKCSFCGTGKHICGVCVAHCKQRVQSVQNEEQK